MSNRRFYVPIEEALPELRRRQAAGIKRKVEAWWEKHRVPAPPLPDLPAMALFARQIAHARFEDVLFAQMARASGFAPVWLEHTADVFSSESSYKRSLLHPKFCTGRGRAGPISVKRRLVGDLTPLYGMPLRDITTCEGESLVAFHNRLWDRMFPQSIRVDCGAYLSLLGGGARSYYAYYLAWFVAHGVLFDEYHDSESGGGIPKPFVRSIFEPAWDRVANEIGFPPLIVSVPWYDGLELFPETPNWESYGIIRM